MDIKNGPWRLALLIVAASFFIASGCYRATRGTEPEATKATAESEASRTETARSESSVPGLSPPDPGASPGGGLPSDRTDSVPEAVPEEPQGKTPPGPPAPLAEGPPPPPLASVPKPSPDVWEKGNGKAIPGSPQKPTLDASAPFPGEDRFHVVVARLPEDRAFPQDGPVWARRKEELVYRVEFLGITMGYARFSFRGKVILSGREAYHLRVRAWTSDLLAIIYPLDDTIDYYLDVQTMAPLRQEYTRSRKEDDVAIYDQEKGTIVYRYRKDGKIRKKVDAVPNVHDPVSVAYYYRTRGVDDGEKGQPMYAGRKLWEVSAKPVGFEQIRTERGNFDTIIIVPVIRKDGKISDKGDLKMWMTRDDRHIPVRVYAKFKKIRTWTLVGELLPDPQEG